MTQKKLFLETLGDLGVQLLQQKSQILSYQKLLNVWKIVIIKIEKIMKIKKGSNKKIVFSRPLEKYVLGN